MSASLGAESLTNFGLRPETNNPGRFQLLISSNVSSIPDFLEHGVGGLVTKNDGYQGFTAVVHMADALMPYELRQLRAQAINRVQTEFPPDVAAGTLVMNGCR